MKIGILTQALTTNYGGILQNYALQITLMRLGHEVWTFDTCKTSWKDWCVATIKTTIKKCLGKKGRYQMTPVQKRKLEKPLRRFVKKNILLTSPRVKLPAAEWVDRYSLDGIIVGSDQVWRPLYNYGYIDDMFLAFAKNAKIKRVAYAASFGTDNWEYSKEEEVVCSALAKKFNGISVREKNGIDLCRKHLGVDATHVLDPTLLLTKEDYTSLCSGILKREPFVFAYILDHTSEKIEDIKHLAESKGLPYLIKSAGPIVADNDSIELWLSYFRDANYIITDSFHGTAFSIIFNKEFYVYGNVGRGNSRFESMLGEFELSERIISGEFAELPVIDWNSVNAKRETMRTFSLQWLESKLQ